MEMEEELAQRVRPLANVAGLDSDVLKDRAKEYWSAITSLGQEKKQLAKRLEKRIAPPPVSDPNNI